MSLGGFFLFMRILYQRECLGPTLQQTSRSAGLAPDIMLTATTNTATLPACGNLSKKSPGP
jgi:hypothetical protein